MMMNGLMLQQYPVMEQNMPDLTSASANQTPVVKKKRNLPGNPDPDAEVIALSPKTLMATNRFVCEICNKGFQRDQNLQLHRRGHNVPWKLKTRTSKEVRKKVYVCPEPTCVHHEPSRALGDLTGIKKHFCRKHGEKKWKCDKCSKHYAVQADWKAHSKTCGTREYRCDCGTLFSRRDSFITHRAFCDALSEESARAITTNPFLSSQSGTSTSHINLYPQFINGQVLQSLSLKKEQQHQPQYFNLKPEIENPNPSPSPSFSHYHPSASLHMSATALLHSAAQMGSTMSKPSSSAMVIPHQPHMSSFDLGLASREEMESGFVNGSGSFRDEAGLTSVLMDHVSANSNAVGDPSLLQDMMRSLSSASGLNSSSFGDGFGGMSSSKRDINQDKHETFSNTKTTSSTTHHSRHDEGGGGGHGGSGGGGGGNGGDGLTRDFLSLRAFSHRDIFNIVGLDHCMSSSTYDHHQSQNRKPWQG
ncbi:protein indeterminate-domain 11-like [Macadamia integrifolia]|uniref:protein indeterminate-domain 11-like n=1 Tax=Macadamia integrifolia TaxID=60698 RepID=UPI001C4E4C23|nr:protein indeterminate-domain 11-like [Macadamia integrifolia]